MSSAAHHELMTAAIQRDGDAQRSLLVGDPVAAREAFVEAADLYRRSWEQAPPHAYGRLVGMLKSSILSGQADEAAAYARDALADEDPVTASATASYARALAALIERDDVDARRWSKQMAAGGDAFDRTAQAIAALADGDEPAYGIALDQIVRDFEQRQGHLTGVAIADTALMLQRLAAHRGMAAEVDSPVLPSI
jgi:hypothetical protein